MSKKVPKPERRFKAVRQLSGVEIVIQNPCQVHWADMEGDGHVRKCPYCQLNVYNFLGMSPDQILDLINRYEGKLCAQFYARADGTMTLEPCSETGRNSLERGGILLIEKQ